MSALFTHMYTNVRYTALKTVIGYFDLITHDAYAKHACPYSLNIFLSDINAFKH